MLTKTCIAHFVVILSIFIFFSAYTSQTKDFFAGKKSFQTDDFPDLITSQCDIAPPSNVELKTKTVSSNWGEYVIKDSSKEYVTEINRCFKMCLGNIIGKSCHMSAGHVKTLNQLDSLTKNRINAILNLLPSDNSNTLDTLYQQLQNAQKKVCPAIEVNKKDLTREGANLASLKEGIHACLTLVEYHRKNMPTDSVPEKASFQVQGEMSRIEKLEEKVQKLETLVGQCLNVLSGGFCVPNKTQTSQSKKPCFSLTQVILGGCALTGFVIIVMLMVQKKMY